MSLVLLDNVKYISKPLIAGSLLWAYDVFVEGITYKSTTPIYDGACMACSVFVGKLLKDLIVDMLKFNEDAIQSKAIEPVVNAFIYSYGYNHIMVSMFGGINNRTNNINMILPVLITMISSYVENPLTALILGFQNI